MLSSETIRPTEHGVAVAGNRSTSSATAHCGSLLEAASPAPTGIMSPARNDLRAMTTKFRVESEDLTPALREKAERELRETPERRAQAIAELRELLGKETDIYFGDTDEILIKYLRPVKFYPESAIELMKRIAEFKQKNAAVVENLMPVQLEEVMLKHKGVNVLVDRDQDGRRILIAQVGKNWDTSKVSNVHIFQLFYLIHLAALVEPATQVNGVVVIMDFEGLGFKQITELTPAFSKRLLSFIQEAMPLRLKQVHIVKQPQIFNLVWKIFNPLIQKKLRDRLHFHGSNMKSLHEFIQPSHLPEDYGGALPKIDYSSKEWYPVLRSLDPVIKEINSFGYRTKK